MDEGSLGAFNWHLARNLGMAERMKDKSLRSGGTWLGGLGINDLDLYEYLAAGIAWRLNEADLRNNQSRSSLDYLFVLTFDRDCSSDCIAMMRSCGEFVSPSVIPDKYALPSWTCPTPAKIPWYNQASLMSKEE